MISNSTVEDLHYDGSAVVSDRAKPASSYGRDCASTRYHVREEPFGEGRSAHDLLAFKVCPFIVSYAAATCIISNDHTQLTIIIPSCEILTGVFNKRIREDCCT